MKTRRINLSPADFKIEKDNGKPVLMFSEYRYECDTRIEIRIHLSAHWWLGYFAKEMRKWLNSRIEEIEETLENFNDHD